MRAPIRILALLLCSLSFAGPLRAAPAVCQSDSECSKAAFSQGVAAYEAGDYPTALTRFSEAYRLRAHPVIAYNLALAEAKNSLFLQAVSRLDAVQKDPKTPENLKARIASERESAARNLSTLLVDSPSDGFAVEVDGQPLRGSPPKSLLNPGAHRISIRTPKGSTLHRSLSLVAGETMRVVIDSSSELRLVVNDDAPRQKAPTAGEPSAEKPLSPLWFYVGLGSTVAVGALATWSGLDTLSAFHDYESDLPRLSQQQADARVSDGHSKETRTNLLIGTTGLLAAGTAAVGLWFVNWSTPSGNVSVRPTTSGLLLHGRF